jgi:hypothetical protein
MQIVVVLHACELLVFCVWKYILNHHKRYIGDPDVMQNDAAPSTRQEQPPESTGVINRVGVRVPPLWPEKPAVWFAQLEG